MVDKYIHLDFQTSIMSVARLIGEIPQWLFLRTPIQPLTNLTLVRYRRGKHWDPKFKRLRALKVIKVDLPNYHKNEENLPEYKMRQKMKELGLQPPRPWMERQFHISCTSSIVEPYVPPEGDGKMSIVSTAGAKQKFEFVEKKSRSLMAIRKIKSFDDDFKTSEFAQIAQDIYIKSHIYMAEGDKEKLEEVVTERCYPQILANTERKTIHWKFLKSLEPPRVVYARAMSIFTKENVFAQVTVRFHTQQQLAVYDRFGRLIHGSEILAKDVLEYVIFEKHLSNVYGVWRVHDKIIPNWMPPAEPTRKTFVKSDPKEEKKEQSTKEQPKELIEFEKRRTPLKEEITPP